MTTAHPPVRPDAEMLNPTLRWGNCLWFALFKWISGYRKGDHLIIRKSRFWWGPHFIFSEDLKTFEQFGPPEPKKRLFPPPIFRGSVKRFTSEEGDR